MISASKIMDFKGHRESVYALADGFRENTFVSAGADGMIVEWEQGSADGKMIAGVSEPVYILLKSGERIFAGTRSGIIHVIEESNSVSKAIKAHDSSVFSLCTALIKNKPCVISGAFDGTIKIWDENLDLFFELNAGHKSIRTLAWDEQLQTLFCGSSDHLIYEIQLPSMNTRLLKGHENSVFSVCIDKERNRLISGGRDAKIRIFDHPGLDFPVKNIDAHWFPINQLLLSPDKKLLASCSLDKTIKIWNAETFELLRVLNKEHDGGHSSSVNSVLWLNNHSLVTCSDDRSAIVWAID